MLSEQKMVLKYCKNLEQEGKSFSVEVPFFHRSIDLVIKKNDNEYSAVEFKLKNWKKAITQAKDYLLGAESAFICIPKNILSKNIESMINHSGCGLIIFDEEKDEFIIHTNPSKRNSPNKGYSIMNRGFRFALENNNYQYLLSLNQ